LGQTDRKGKADIQGHTGFDHLLRSEVSRHDGLLVNIRGFFLDGSIVVDEQFQKADILHRKALVEQLHKKFVVDTDLAILIFQPTLNQEEDLASHCMVEQPGASLVIENLLENLTRLPDTAAFKLHLVFFGGLLRYVIRHDGVGIRELIDNLDTRDGASREVSVLCGGRGCGRGCRWENPG